MSRGGGDCGWRQAPRMKTLVPSISEHTERAYRVCPAKFIFPLVSVPMIYKWQSHYTASSRNDKAAGNLSLLRLAGHHCLSWVPLDNHQVNARQVSYRIDLNLVSRDLRI